MDRALLGPRAWMLAALLPLALGACSVEVREGLFACGDDTECPAGWTCRMPEGRCHRTAADDGALGGDAGALDAGAPRDATVDGSTVDGSTIDGSTGDGSTGDGSAPDAGPIDAGPIDGGPPDEDRDGVPDAIDCGPLDPTIGGAASRSCASGCGPGEELCVEGAWTECDAPTTCDCSEGATQTIACGFCGVQLQQCTDNRWVDVGACVGSGECAAGTTEIASESCVGGCGTLGTHARSRTCDATCRWGAWSAFGACHSCAPSTQTETAPCGACGTWTRSRSCDTATCGWGAWGAFGACTGEGECMAGDSDVEQCGTVLTCDGRRGTHERYCSDSCAWGAWGGCWCP